MRGVGERPYEFEELHTAGSGSVDVDVAVVFETWGDVRCRFVAGEGTYSCIGTEKAGTAA
jgi:hypothetical protein